MLLTYTEFVIGKLAAEFQICAADFTRKIAENAFSYHGIWLQPVAKNQDLYP